MGPILEADTGAEGAVALVGRPYVGIGSFGPLGASGNGKEEQQGKMKEATYGLHQSSDQRVPQTQRAAF